MKRLEPLKAVSLDHMNWTISLAKNPNYLYVVVKGRFELSEFREMLDDVSSLKAGLPEYPVLFSDLEFDVSSVKKKDIAAASTHFVMKNPSLANSRVAIVMKTDEDLEIADTWKMMTQPGSTAKLNLFRNERKARKWLTQTA